MLFNKKVDNSAVLLNGNEQYTSWFKGMSSNTHCQHAHFYPSACVDMCNGFCQSGHVSGLQVLYSCVVDRGSVANKSLLLFPLPWLKQHATQILLPSGWHWENPPESQIWSQRPIQLIMWLQFYYRRQPKAESINQMSAYSTFSSLHVVSFGLGGNSTG